MLPKATCTFNPTEQVWMVVKGRYRVRLSDLSATAPITKLQFEMLVDEACRSVSKRHMDKLLTTNDKELANYQDMTI